jgi:hypothetical protein
VGGGGSIKFLLTFPTFKFSSTNRIGQIRLKGFVYKMFTRIKIFIFSMKNNNTSDK